MHCIVAYLVDILGRFGKGVLSTTYEDALLAQLPLKGSSAADDCTRSDAAFSKYCLTDGLSFHPPLYLCFPK